MTPEKMTNQKMNLSEAMDQAVTALRAEEPPAEIIEAAGVRVWQRLRQDTADKAVLNQGSIRGCEGVRHLLPEYRAGVLPAPRVMLVEDHLHECPACRHEAESLRGAAGTLPNSWSSALPRVSNRGFYRALGAAAAVLVISVSAYLIQDRIFSAPAGMRARVESLSGALYRVGVSGEQALKIGDELQEGENVRTGDDSRAMLRLGDGSLVEMNERAQFAVSMARRDTTVALDRGDIIVQAAKRQRGHLYVIAKDCRVSVTGTVFSVNSGIKGSRVSVIEGEVRVAGPSGSRVLHPGDQLSTSASVTPVPVTKEISWSQNADKHLAMLAEFVHLANKLETTVELPGLRYQSKLLPFLPADTMLFASIPNLGDAAQQANQLFQQELTESPVLREWWQQVQAQKHGPDLEEILNEVHTLAGYLGEEIIFFVSSDSRYYGGVVVAQVGKPGLKEFLIKEYANQPKVHIVDEKELAGLSGQETPAVNILGGFFILVRSDLVIASVSASSLRAFDRTLTHGGAGFVNTAFGQQMSAAYQHGAGILLGANLEEMATEHLSHSHATLEQGKIFAQSGLNDVHFLVAERKQVDGRPFNQAVLSFNGPRQGIASWLAAPAPIGGLDYVSKDAGGVAAFVTKSPAKMLDDVLNIVSSSNPNAQNRIAQGEESLNIKLHQDLADTLGGEITLALDGPVLPTPSWKVILEVNDPVKLEATIQQLVALGEHFKRGEHGSTPAPVVTLSQETVNGLVYYTLRPQDGNNLHEIDYTFTNGYMILGPSRAMIMQALGIHQGGNSLAASDGFKALLPHDDHPNVSALVYQNLAPVLGPVMQQLPMAETQSLQQLAAETKPSLVCAYGDEDSIRLASTSPFFGLDLNTLALTTLLRLAHPGGVPTR
ncbi:MAG TPA: FecR domain-containing protein [Terriglobales bacterium]